MSTILYIPVYNCELQIKRLIKKLKRKKLKKINEILFVDNQSVDETLKTLVNETKGFSSKITIIQNNKNYGLGGSHKVALSYAINNRYNDLIVFHGDDQGKIEDLDKIILSDKKRKYDFILGSRFMKGSILNNYNLIRILGNIFFNFIFSAITLKKLYDLGAGLNLLRLDNLDINQIKSFPNNLTFNYHLILYLCFFKKKFMFMPITWTETDQISNVKYFNHTIQMFNIILQFLFNKKKFFKKKKTNYIFKIIN